MRSLPTKPTILGAGFRRTPQAAGFVQSLAAAHSLSLSVMSGKILCGRVAVRSVMSGPPDPLSAVLSLEADRTELSWSVILEGQEDRDGLPDSEGPVEVLKT